ncbi:hypothetical protein [Rhodanobacter sp. KK11]|jgi:hypothetical protein|uniref:hypothetical protein n=1 Tax=Rhodanobacter sp. KK11 TaxID=3083255 RepID=UPI002965EEB5|nr:hypothetical protein [Rhodanobacter sp. KK11]MDW2982190.1 hypothetical protein [Rhodanobacter sp. KK11]
MPNLLKVTLDNSTSPPSLDIDQKDNANHVSRGPNAQTITWQLNGNAASGSFNAQNAAKPGFAWVDPAPPAGIFGSPTLSSNGNEITMSDLNNSASTAGDWVYQLSATIGGVVYQSNKTSLTETNTNPSIKNN